MDGVSVGLTRDEALVLFELLHRWEDAGAVDPDLLVGEQTALWNLSAALERVLVEPFDSTYGEVVAEARTRLAGIEGAS